MLRMQVREDLQEGLEGPLYGPKRYHDSARRVLRGHVSGTGRRRVSAALAALLSFVGRTAVAWVFSSGCRRTLRSPLERCDVQHVRGGWLHVERQLRRSTTPSTTDTGGQRYIHAKEPTGGEGGGVPRRNTPTSTNSKTKGSARHCQNRDIRRS